MRVGILTGGGDCPGLNPAIRGIVMRGLDHGFEMHGIQLGWKGLVEGIVAPIGLEQVEGIIDQGGTILGSSRTNPFKPGNEHQLEACLKNFKEFGFDALIALGGEDTLGVASKLFKMGLPTVGIPKTMDNDLDYTDYTFGFDSAASVALDAADRLRDTAKSHRRILVLEVMGRHAGWMALYCGIAAGADWILLPEVPLDLEEMCGHLLRQRARGRDWGLIVASEGVDIPAADTEDISVDAFGHVILRERGVGEFVAKEIEKRVGVETRSVVLGHVQRGGSPTVFDRVLATRLGIKGADLVKEGSFGKMASLQGNQVVAVDLDLAVRVLKTVPIDFWETVKTLFK